MTKSELRKIYLINQRSLSPEERAENSLRIAGQFFRDFDLSKVKFLHCFITIEKFNEIDTTIIFQRLWKEFPQVITLVPRVEFEKNEIRNLKFTPDTELVKNIWDIHEPLHNEYIAAEEIDMVLVPGLCFDAAGHRVGYGKGFYDRLLSKCRSDCLKIGLSYLDPVEIITDAWEQDVRLDFCVTPEQIYQFQIAR